MKYVRVMSLVLVLGGCHADPPETASEGGGAMAPPPRKSSRELLVGGVTGKYAVEAGQRARTDIQAAAEQRDAHLAEMLDQD